MSKEEETDISDYYDSDMIHIRKSIFGKNFQKRSAVISKQQFKFIVWSAVNEAVEKGFVDDVPSAMAFFRDLILDISISINGKGINALIEAIKYRLAIADLKKIKQSENSDMESR